MVTPAVGCRVRILKDYATVRYIGPVAQQQGTWVGVEWEDTSRGKHDGSTAGVRYFTCASGTTSGSFVRIERVNFGVTVLDALRARYNNETAEYGEIVAPEELYVHTSRRRRVQVQLVGEDKIQQKQRQIHTLTSARLVGLDVSAVGDPSQLRSCVPSLTSLDLTCNLVAHWDFVEQLAGQQQQQQQQLEQQQGDAEGHVHIRSLAALPGLVVLNLSENHMTMPSTSFSTAQTPGKGFTPPSPRVLIPCLRVLVLNDCGLTWLQVLSVAPSLPSLEELHLCGNPITDLQPTNCKQPLDCNNDQPPQLPSTSDAQQQEPQPQLQPAMSEGRADGSCGDRGGGGGGGDEQVEAEAELLASLFPRLQVLALEDCQLYDWTTLELLKRLPALTRLHLAGNTAIKHIKYPTYCRTGTTTATIVMTTMTATDAAAEGQPAPPTPPTEAAAAAAVTTVTASSSSPSPSSPGPSSGPAFPRLIALLLGGCGVAEWSSVNELDKFPELTELRLTGNPVLTTSKTGGRFEVIGRVSRLTHLNGAEVRHRERRDSELRYLQHIASEMEAAGQDEAHRAAVRAANPRLRKLMELHGTVLATAGRGGAGGGGSLAASMVELKLTCVAAGASAKMGTQVKKLPKSTTVSALRLLCERLFKVKSAQMALFLRAPGEPLPEDMGGLREQEDRSLVCFGVQDGYEVLIDEVDPDSLKRTDEDSRAAAAAAHEQRLAGQLRAAEKMQAEFARTMGLQQQQQQ